MATKPIERPQPEVIPPVHPDELRDALVSLTQFWESNSTLLDVTTCESPGSFVSQLITSPFFAGIKWLYQHYQSEPGMFVRIFYRSWALERLIQQGVLNEWVAQSADWATTRKVHLAAIKAAALQPISLNSEFDVPSFILAVERYASSMENSQNSACE